MRVREKQFLILHVEDEPAHAEIVRRALESFPCQIQQVEDGQQALDYLYHLRDYQVPGTSLRPNLVLLDLNLPKVSGFDILRAIKTDPDLMSIPTVILSTSSACVDLREAYSRHANGYTLKTGDFEKQKTMLNALALYWSEYNCTETSPL
jgi:two-component system, response regulator